MYPGHFLDELYSPKVRKTPRAVFQWNLFYEENSDQAHDHENEAEDKDIVYALRQTAFDSLNGDI